LYTAYIAWRRGDGAAARAAYVRSAGAAEATPAVGGFSAEGDTKAGGALGQQHVRCDELRAASSNASSADPDRSMTADYRKLDHLLARFRAR
jgi:hypothetical protein